MYEIELELPPDPNNKKHTFFLSEQTAFLLDRYTEGAKTKNRNATKDLIVETILAKHFAKDRTFQQSLRAKQPIKEAS